MTYSTLMVRLQAGRSNARLLQIVGDLAERFHSGVVGIAACQPMQILYDDGCYASGQLIEQDRVEIEKELEEAAIEFRSVLETRVDVLEWRSRVTLEPLSDYIAREARCADIVITSFPTGDLPDASRRVDASALVMQVGRPVLVVPDSADRPKLERAIIAWKDTREARRAAFDALPLLKTAAYVAVVEIASEDRLAEARRHLADVVGWLKRQGVAAVPILLPSGEDDAARLNRVAEEQGADLVVAGAYGHSRLREWALGGVTRDLLLRPDRCSLLSH